MIVTLTTAHPSRTACPSLKTHPRISSPCSWVLWLQRTQVCITVQHTQWVKFIVSLDLNFSARDLRNQGRGVIQITACPDSAPRSSTDTHMNSFPRNSVPTLPAPTRHHHAQCFCRSLWLRSSEVFPFVVVFPGSSVWTQNQVLPVEFLYPFSQTTRSLLF
jgi:hypothetical protein